MRLFRAVCNAFPALSTYGGYDAHGEHSSGRAIDFMISDPALGQAVADWARAHASELDLYDVLWSQHIWTPGALLGGLALDAGPRLADREPLRPRAHLGQLTGTAAPGPEPGDLTFVTVRS